MVKFAVCQERRREVEAGKELLRCLVEISAGITKNSARR